MADNRRFERIGIVLAVLMSAGALGLEIHQRRAPAPPPNPASPPGSTGAVPPLMGSTPEGPIEPMPVPKDGKEIIAKGKDLIRMQGIVGGRKFYELTAQRMILTRDESTATVEGIHGTMIAGKDGKPSGTFSAERAIMNIQTKDLQIQGQVHVESTDPKNKLSFDTRDMNWTAATETLTCPNPVEVQQPGIVLRGSNMKADVRLKKLSLDGGIYLEADAEKVEKTLGVGGGAAKPAAGSGKGRKGGR